MTNKSHLPPYVLEVEDVPSYWQIGILWKVLLSAEATAGQFSMIDQLMPQGSGPPPHRHERFDEGFHLLDGEIEYTLGDGDDQRTVLAKTGDSLWIPRNTTHTFNVASDTVRALNFYTSGGWEDHLTFLAAPATAQTLPPEDADAESRQIDPEKRQDFLNRLSQLHTDGVLKSMSIHLKHRTGCEAQNRSRTDASGSHTRRRKSSDIRKP